LFQFLLEVFKKLHNTRGQVIRQYVFSQVLGIMGALDPHAHKRNQHNLPGQHREVLRPTIETAQHIVSMEELPTDFWPSFSASEDYYSTVWFHVPSLGI
jgi:FKBP12-rapamycin complex-associated protein